MTRGCGGRFSGCRPPRAPRGAPARPLAAPSREPAFTFAADRRVCSGPARADERRPARSGRGAGGGQQVRAARPGSAPSAVCGNCEGSRRHCAVGLGWGVGASPARAPGLRTMKEPGPSWAKEAEGPWGCCLSICPPGSGRDPGPGPCWGAASPSPSAPALVGTCALSLSLSLFLSLAYSLSQIST